MHMLALKQYVYTEELINFLKMRDQDPISSLENQYVLTEEKKDNHLTSSVMVQKIVMINT